MNNKKIKTALVAAMLTSTMTYNIPAISAATLTQKNVDNPVLVPTPKKVTYEENILSISGNTYYDESTSARYFSHRGL